MLLIATIEYVPLVKKLARKTSIKDKRSVTIDDDLPNLVCEAQAEKFRDCDDGQLYCNHFGLKKDGMVS